MQRELVNQALFANVDIYNPYNWELKAGGGEVQPCQGEKSKIGFSKFSFYICFLDVFEDFISPTTAAQTLLFTACSKRKEVSY